MTSLTSVVPKLPLTKIAFVDVETFGLDARWNPALPVYCVCLIVVSPDSVKPKIHKFLDVDNGVRFVQKLLNLGYFLIAHNAKFDYSVLKIRGLKHTIKPGILSWGDTMVMEYHRDSKPKGGLSLDALTGMKTDVVQSFVDAGVLTEPVKSEKFWQMDWSNNQQALELIANYCVDDLKATHKLYKRTAAWYNQPQHAKFTKALIDIEFPMLEALSQLEINGVYIDQERLSCLSHQLTTELAAAKENLSKTYYGLPKLQWNGEVFVPFEKTYAKDHYKNKNNIAHYLDSSGSVNASDPYTIYNHCPLTPYNSASATGHNWWLLNKECPEVLEKAKDSKLSGKKQLDKDFLSKAEIPDNLPIATIAKLQKSLSMAEGFSKHIQVDGRIHGSFLNTKVRTGRLATNNPNLQNFPRADKDSQSIGSQFRQLVSARPGYVMLGADLDRIEIVVLGWYLSVVCKDNSLLEICNTEGSDVHQANADKWGVSRSVAKTVMFALAYGAAARRLFEQGVGSSVDEAQQIIDNIYNSQPSLMQLKQLIWERATKRGYITNQFGCRVPYPELKSKNFRERGEGERQSFNCLIQRTARDVMHLLVIQSLPILEANRANIVSIIHDEVLVECPSETADDTLSLLNKVWQSRYDILKGAKVNGDWMKGNNWYEAKGV